MTFYRNTITINVLSDEDIIEWPLERIIEACDTGPCVLASMELGRCQLDPVEMARALTVAGSEPGFFQLDDEGNEVDA